MAPSPRRCVEGRRPSSSPARPRGPGRSSWPLAAAADHLHLHLHLREGLRHVCQEAGAAASWSALPSPVGAAASSSASRRADDLDGLLIRADGVIGSGTSGSVLQATLWGLPCAVKVRLRRGVVWCGAVRCGRTGRRTAAARTHTHAQHSVTRRLAELLQLKLRVCFHAPSFHAPSTLAAGCAPPCRCLITRTRQVIHSARSTGACTLMRTRITRPIAARRHRAALQDAQAQAQAQVPCRVSWSARAGSHGSGQQHGACKSSTCGRAGGPIAWPWSLP